MKVCVILAAVFVLSVCGKDATDTQYAIGSEVVVSSIRKVQDTCIFPNDLLFLRRLAFVGSRDGDDLKSYWNSDKGRNGIWQTTSAMLSAAQNSDSQILTNLQTQIGINISGLNWRSGDLDVPVNDAAVARLYTNAQGVIPLDINAQATYWVNNYNPSGTTDQFIAAANQMPKCTPPGMDLFFIVDDSGSIGEDIFQNVRNFMMTIIDSLRSGQANRVGIVRFDTTAALILSLTSDLDFAYQTAGSLEYTGQGTDIAAGLNVAYQEFTQHARSNVPLVALLVTDGGDSDPAIVTSSNNLKNLGVNLFSIGVGGEAAADLLIWSSEPHCMFYYSLNDFTELAESFPELLNSQICEVSAVIPSVEACINGTVQQGQYVFFQIPVDPSTGVTVKLEMESGAATIYLSLTSRLPSAADFDFFATANIALPGQIYISLSQLSSNNLTYAAIIGLGNENIFSLCNERGDTVENFTTPAPMTTNSSCISLDLIFILDRAQSVNAEYYNTNVTHFVLDIANQFMFHDEASGGMPAFARFGVIEFSTDASVTIPLGNYSRSQFNKFVKDRVEYNITDGTTQIDEAFMAAYFQFQQNSFHRNKAIILVVDDVTKQNIQDSKDALNRLLNFVTLPMGTVMGGSWGDLQEAYGHLQNLLGNKTTFPMMETSEGDILDLMDNTYPCTSIPACSAIIFVEEATVAIGPHSKLTFLNLVSRLVNSIDHTPNQRFGIAQYAQNVIKDIEMQMFDDFNRTLNDLIRNEVDNGNPSGGTTYLTPILSRINSTIYERIYSSYSILLMGELQSVRDIGQAQKFASSIAASRANVYVLDETKNLPSSAFWDILTGNAPGHVINGTNATPELLYATFSQTIITDFLARGC